MKRFTQFILAILFAGSGLMAQGLQVVVTGTVTDSNSVAIANHTVYIMTDSSNTTVSFFTSTHTNANGVYTATCLIPSLTPVTLVIMTPNCNGTALVQTALTSTSLITANFVLCVGPPPPPCSNNFTWNSTLVGNTFSFSGQVSPQGPAVYTWNFGDGTSGTGQFIQHTYLLPGTYTVTLTTVSGNCTATSSHIIVVGPPQGCHALFNAFPQPSNTLTWGFNNQSTGSPNLSFHWSFGDGSYSLAPNPIHTYLQAGVYVVCLTISDSSANCFDTYCDSISVGNTMTPCQSNFTQQVSGLTVALSGHMASTGTTAVYHWDFGDNTIGTGQNVTHTYSQPGVYFVCLTTVTPLGCTFTSCHQIIVGVTPGCQAHFAWMPDSNGTGAIFMDASIGNPTSWHWSFGDGTSSNLQNPGLHLYNGFGPYYVCLTINDSATNCHSTFCDTLFLQNSNCFSHFTHSSQPGNALSVTFHGFSSMANAGFQWDFGDGTFGTGQTVTHTYLQGGLYHVCMKAVGAFITCPAVCLNINVGGGTSVNASIAGVVFTFNQHADFGRVFLIEFDSIANTLTAIDTVSLDSNGFFFFTNVPFGNYFLKAALTPASSVYSGYMPTYYGNSLTWNYAQYLHAGPFMPAVLVQIHLIAGANPGGPGFIGGNVTTGANKVLDEGSRIDGVQVTVTDMMDVPVAYALSNSLGMFNIPNLAYGTYKIYAEIPGLHTVPGIVTLDANNPGITSIQITISSTQVITGIGQISESVDYVGPLFPNPVSDVVSIQIGMTRAAAINFNVIDQSGRIVRSIQREAGAGIELYQLDLSGLTAGYYMISIQTDDGSRVMRNLVKM